MSTSVTDVLQSWTAQPVAICVAIGALWAYHRGERRLAETSARWPKARTVIFAASVAGYLLLSCGPSQYYGQRLFWVWLSQLLMLLLVLPICLVSGRPTELAARTTPDGLVTRVLRSQVGRALTSPVIGPALIPLACVAFLFGPVPGWALNHQPVNWLVQLLALLIGCLIVLPLVSPDDNASSQAVGLALAVGVVELLLDAIPGLVMRLSTHPSSTFFEHRRTMSDQLTPLRDQQIAGAILWCVAELLDLPYLLLIFRRWLRADAREAAAVDAELDANTPIVATDESEQPWFMTDPQLKHRLQQRL